MGYGIRLSVPVGLQSGAGDLHACGAVPPRVGGDLEEELGHVGPRDRFRERDRDLGGGLVGALCRLVGELVWADESDGYVRLATNAKVGRTAESPADESLSISRARARSENPASKAALA